MTPWMIPLGRIMPLRMLVQGYDGTPVKLTATTITANISFVIPSSLRFLTFTEASWPRSPSS